MLPPAFGHILRLTGAKQAQLLDLIAKIICRADVSFRNQLTHSLKSAIHVVDLIRAELMRK